MLQRNGVRLVAEVVLLFVAAAVAGPLLHLGAWAIIGVVVVAWGAIAVFEYGRAHPQAARRATARRPRPARVAPAAAAPVDLDEEVAFEHVRVLGSRPAATDAPPEPPPPPAAEPSPPEPEPERVPVRAPEAEPAPQPVAQPVAHPEPEPAPAPPREPEPDPEPLPVASAPWSWNVWNLERVVRERAAANDELNYLLLYLREYANPAGMLPPDFDALVRESFGDLLAAPS